MHYFNWIKLTIWTICEFRVLNPHQWSLAKNVVQVSKSVCIALYLYNSWRWPELLPNGIYAIKDQKNGGRHDRLSCARESTAFLRKSFDTFIVILLPEFLPMVQSEEVLQTCCIRIESDDIKKHIANFQVSITLTIISNWRAGISLCQCTAVSSQSPMTLTLTKVKSIVSTEKKSSNVVCFQDLKVICNLSVNRICWYLGFAVYDVGLFLIDHHLTMFCEMLQKYVFSPKVPFDAVHWNKSSPVFSKGSFHHRFSLFMVVQQ